MIPVSLINPQIQNNQPQSLLLSLPPEIRILLYTHLFQCPYAIKIEPERPDPQAEGDLPWRMKPPDCENQRTPYPSDNNVNTATTLTRSRSTKGLSSQILQTCRKVHAEGHAHLYGLNRFDVSAREAIPLLQTYIPTSTFTHIRHLILDWDQLQEFAWSLAKPTQHAATAGLHMLDIASSRMRVERLSSSSSSATATATTTTTTTTTPAPATATATDDQFSSTNFLWRDNKSYERQMCQAALDICRKHARLRFVLQTRFQRTAPRQQQQQQQQHHHQQPQHSALQATAVKRITYRIKWRFVSASCVSLRAGEEVVDLSAELAAVALADGKDVGMSVVGMMDPI